MASEGIYYLIRTPAGWELLTRLFTAGDDTDHSAWWETEVAARVAAAWAKPRQLLINHPYAFPRGRISFAMDTYLVLHGADLKPAMKISKRAIEAAFSITGRCEWLYDDHECCQQEDQAAVCRHLDLKPAWSAV